MVEDLRKLLNNSKPKLSNYSVACIIECLDGTSFKGVNVETSSPSAGVCAERNALYNLLASGYNKDDIKSINIMNKTNDPCYPCFICRQALIDFCKIDTPIICYNYQGKYKKVILKDLCPYPFSDNDLN